MVQTPPSPHHRPNPPRLPHPKQCQLQQTHQSMQHSRRLLREKKTPTPRPASSEPHTSSSTHIFSPALSPRKSDNELSLSLQDNSLIDRIPHQIVDCRKLEVLNLGNNHFSREVPTQLSSLIRLRILDLSSNKFSGDLSFLKHFSNLESLSIADNLFSGKIPASVRSFRNLRFFNFAGNEFLKGSPKLKGVDIPRRFIFAKTSNSSSPTKSNTSRSSSSIVAAPSGSKAQAPGPSATPTNRGRARKYDKGGQTHKSFNI